MRLATMLLSAALLAGCGLMPGGTDVRLLTGSPNDGGCFLAEATGMLVADAIYGTAIVGMGGNVGPGDTFAVAWRPGFTGRKAGGEIEVLDPDGHVVATTGQRYLLDGGFADIGGTRAWWSCGAVTPL